MEEELELIKVIGLINNDFSKSPVEKLTEIETLIAEYRIENTSEFANK